MRTTWKLTLPADGPVSWKVRDDLAAAAAVALTDTSLFDGITAPLTGARTYTFADVAVLVSEILNREILREEISDAEYRQNALEREEGS